MGRARYGALGVTYRRAYLFSGPPGVGKTSAVLALAGRFDRPLCLLPELGEENKSILAALNKAPSRAAFLFEDAEVKPENLRELLNSLDGVSTPEDTLFILTTNSPEALEAFPALMRPGRVDLHLRFPAPDSSTAVRLFERFYGVKPDETDQWCSNVKNMAELQHWLMECDRCRLDAKSCADFLNR